MLNIQTRQEGKTAVITIKGKVNYEATAQLRDVIRSTVDNLQPGLLVINLKGVTSIDSSGLGLLVGTRDRMDKISGKLHLCELQSQVEKTFIETNLKNYFRIFATEPEAGS